MGNQTISRINIRSNISCKMLRLSLILALVFVGISSGLPVAQQAAAGGQGDQRIFGNLLGAVQGAWNGLTRPEQYNDNFGFGYPLTTNNFGGGGFQGGYNQGGFNQGYNQGYGGFNQGYGGFNQGYGGYNQGYGGYNQWG